MNISLNWLKDYLNVDFSELNIDDLVHRLAILGFEAESVEEISKDFEKVVVGKVVSKEKHPDADKLSVCQVKVDENETEESIVQIVCGAPNVAEGQTVPVALVGAKFGDFKIKKGKIRGVHSYGMICAADELELGDDHSGIMVLEDKYAAGTPLKELFGYEDKVIELEITPNRPDVMGYFGFARELGFLLQHSLEKPEVKLAENSENINDYIKITNQEPKACPRYASRLVKNCQVAESPEWLKERLLAIGLRPINNIVDVTNYILMETGHPMHAFDYQEIKGQEIVIRYAKEGEKFVTLDGAEITLNTENLLICNAEEPVALAGVMGGLHSGVSSETKDVLLEVAYFNLADIRHTVNKHKIISDSSKRFERGVDPNDVEYVINRAAQLMSELSGGEIVAGICDNYPERIEEKKIVTRFSRAEKVLGFPIPQEETIKNLNDIELRSNRISDDEIEVTIPTFRGDITKEIDVIEEIVRLYGYDKIPANLKTEVDLQIKDSEEELITNKVRKAFLNLGLYETASKSMIDGKYCHHFEGNPVKIAHPLNEEQNHLRNSLLISMLAVTRNNLNRKNEKINIFEVNKQFNLNEKDIIEANYGALILAGKKDDQSWNVPEAKYDFYDLKGHAEEFLADLGINNCVLKQEDIPKYFDEDETLSIYLDKKKVGSFGLISAEVLKGFEISENVYAFEVNLDILNRCLKGKAFKLEPLSKFPKVVKDLSFKMERNMTSEIVEAALKKYGGKFLVKTEVVDYYEGDQLPESFKSYSYRLTYQALEKTLKDKEIEKMFNKTISGVVKELNIELR